MGLVDTSESTYNFSSDYGTGGTWVGEGGQTLEGGSGTSTASSASTFIGSTESGSTVSEWGPTSSSNSFTGSTHIGTSTFTTSGPTPPTIDTTLSSFGATYESTVTGSISYRASSTTTLTVGRTSTTFETTQLSSYRNTDTAFTNPAISNTTTSVTYLAGTQSTTSVTTASTTTGGGFTALTYSVSGPTTATGTTTYSVGDTLGDTIFLDDGVSDAWVMTAISLSVGKVGALEELFERVSVNATFGRSEFLAGTHIDSFYQVFNPTASDMTGTVTTSASYSAFCSTEQVTSTLTAGGTTDTVITTISVFSTVSTPQVLPTAHQSILNGQGLNNLTTDTSLSTFEISSSGDSTVSSFFTASTYTEQVATLTTLTMTTFATLSDLRMGVDLNHIQDGTSASHTYTLQADTTAEVTLTREGKTIECDTNTDTALGPVGGLTNGETDTINEFSFYQFSVISGSAWAFGVGSEGIYPVATASMQNGEFVPVAPQGLLSIKGQGESTSLYRGITLGSFTSNTTNTAVTSTTSFWLNPNALLIPLPVSLAQRGGSTYVSTDGSGSTHRTDSGGVSVFTTDGPSWTAEGSYMTSRTSSSSNTTASTTASFTVSTTGALWAPISCLFLPPTTSTATTNLSTFKVGITVDAGLSYSVTGSFIDGSGATNLTGEAVSTWNLPAFTNALGALSGPVSDFGSVRGVTVLGGRKAISSAEGTGVLGQGIYQLTSIDTSGGTSTTRTTITDATHTFTIATSELVAVKSFSMFSIIASDGVGLAITQTPRYAHDRFIGDSTALHPYSTGRTGPTGLTV